METAEKRAKCSGANLPRSLAMALREVGHISVNLLDGVKRTHEANTYRNSHHISPVISPWNYSNLSSLVAVALREVGKLFASDSCHFPGNSVNPL